MLSLRGYRKTVPSLTYGIKPCEGYNFIAGAQSINLQGTLDHRGPKFPVVFLSEEIIQLRTIVVQSSSKNQLQTIVVQSFSKNQL